MWDIDGKIKKYRRKIMIYTACPEKFATGGTELLHQLYYK